MKGYPILLSFFLISFYLPTLAFAGKVATSPAPSWVKNIPVDYNHASIEKYAEDGYLDVAFIKQVHVPEQTIFLQKCYKIINEEGIENVSEISVAYDPSYQHLTFHNIHILRAGKKIDKLKKANFRLLQQETDAYMHLYNGTVTALLVLDDVRNGDVIEYAYSIKGFNPVFEGKYADVYSTAYSVPVGQLVYRLIPMHRNPCT